MLLGTKDEAWITVTPRFSWNPESIDLGLCRKVDDSDDLIWIAMTPEEALKLGAKMIVIASEMLVEGTNEEV